MIGKLLNDNIVVRIKKESNEYTTASGIYISGVEHDFLSAEVVQVPDPPFYYDEETDTKLHIDLQVGDTVVLEKNFHAVYNIEARNRVEHTVLLRSDDEYNYYITKYKDILLKSSDDDANGVEIKGLVVGTLYPIMHQLAGTVVKRSS
jgi:co-chaperonin GroES (HSP10)